MKIHSNISSTTHESLSLVVPKEEALVKILFHNFTLHDGELFAFQCHYTFVISIDAVAEF